MAVSDSKIEWTDSTWSPVVGCTHVSPGCDQCYAAKLASGRLAHLPRYAGLAVDGKFTGEVRLVPEVLNQPLRWRRPRRVFVNSMSDLFHDAIPDEYIAQVFAMMAACSQHTFQVLTKRHGRLRSLLSDPGFQDMVIEEWDALVEEHGDRVAGRPGWNWYPLPNVWLGVSVEDQKWADIRIPALLATPAAVRFLSCEPLLGPIDLASYIGGRLISWVIVGGESGPRARPMHPDWARSLRDQCTAAGVPFFFKQAGLVLAREWGCTDRKGHNPTEWPEPFPREYP